MPKRLILFASLVLLMSGCTYSSADYMYRAMEICSDRLKKFNPHSGIIICK